MSKGSSTSSTQVTLPAWQEAQQKELFAAAKGLAGQPFVPYTGAMVAGFNPDQLRQFQATRGLFETGMEYDPLTGLQELAQAPTPTIQTLTGFQAPTISQVTTPTAAQIGGVQAPQFRGLLGADIAAYQSPYQQQVIDVALGDIQRQADIARQQAQSRAIGAGAFGGSRSAILEAEATRPYAEQAARTVAGLRQAGFEQAQRAAEADIARQQQLGIFGAEQAQQRALQQASLQQQAGLLGAEQAQQRALQQAQLQQQAGLAGQDIQARMAQFAPQFQLQAQAQRAGLLGALGGEQMQRLGLLGQIGAQQQQLQQAALQFPYQEFQRALAYGPQQLGIFQAGLGTPLTSQTQTDKRKTGTGDILGTAAQLAGSYFLGKSDERLKQNIEYVGKSINGHNIYTWEWNNIAKKLGVNSPTIGVLAQEVMQYMPEAVIKDVDGYYMVNYGAL